MRQWLITGGAGFIGSHLADALLSRGDRVRVLDDLSSGHRRNLSSAAELVVGCITDTQRVRSALDGVDGVFHLAAIASVVRCTDDWTGTHAINQAGTVAVLDAARSAGGVPVVYASSAAVYGDMAPVVVSETDPTDPCSAYGCDKLGSELHAILGRNRYGLPTLGLRFFNVYGPRQDGASPYSGVISVFRERLKGRKPLVINGDGQQTRDFVYVGDVVAALLAGMQNLCRPLDVTAAVTPAIINVCTGRETSILVLAAALGNLIGVTPAICHAPARIGDIRRSCGNPGLMHSALGIVCATSIQEGLHRLTPDRAVRPGASDRLTNNRERTA